MRSMQAWELDLMVLARWQATGPTAASHVDEGGFKLAMGIGGRLMTARDDWPMAFYFLPPSFGMNEGR